MRFRLALLALLFAGLTPIRLHAGGVATDPRLAGFDAYMDSLLVKWNLPGACVGIVERGRLIHARGYGWRDVEHRLPMTPNTLYQIASNTKLFTATVAGILVDEKLLDFDRPIREQVPSIRFYDDELNRTVTLRDMLAHRTGVSRHDYIWYKSEYTRTELFDRLRFLEPSQGLRQGFLYNNLMYAGAGHVEELVTGKPWETLVTARILQPLGMTRTVFTAKAMAADPDHGLPYEEQRDTTLIKLLPIYEDAQGLGPAGAMISSITDMSRWLIALMNDGRIDGRQAIPASAIRATLQPTIPLGNAGLENRGWGELLNPVYGMGRQTASYRGHLIAYHGGDLPGFHSQISCMPYDSIGVIVWVNADHAQPLYNAVTFNVYERLLGLSLTPWSERRLQDRIAGKAADRAARAKAGSDRVPGTHPSHALADYAGDYENAAYGVLAVSVAGDSLAMKFHKIAMPLHHYHYDRFDSPNDPDDGLFSLNFLTSPQGEVDRFVVSLDEAQATFVRRVDATLADPAVLARYAGKYESAGTVVTVAPAEGGLVLRVPGQPDLELRPARTARFRAREYPDYTFEFVLENGRVVALLQRDPSGEYRLQRRPD